MIKELRKYDTLEIKRMIVQSKSKLLENRFKLSQGELSNTSVFNNLKRTIARLLTVLHERGEVLEPKDWRSYMETVSKTKE